MRPRPVLLLLAVTALLGVGPAAAQEALRIVDVSPTDQQVTAVVDVPGSESAGTPSPEFEVLDGESRLPVVDELVLQPRRSFTLVVDAAGAGAEPRLGELKRTATDLLLRVGTTVEPALVISRPTAPDVLPPSGVVAAVDVVEDLRSGPRTEDALVPAVRAAVASGADAGSGPQVVLVLAASGSDVPPAQLREELSGQQALVHVLTVGEQAQEYWREVVPETAGEVVAASGGPETGAVVRRLAAQHVVSFRKPRTEGTVVLTARTRDAVLTGTIDLGAARAPTGDRGLRSGQVVAVVFAVLALSLVSVGLLAVLARDRQRGSTAGSGHAGATPVAPQRPRRPSAPPSAGRHDRGARSALTRGQPVGQHRGGRVAESSPAAPGHDAPDGPGGAAGPATGRRGAAARRQQDVPGGADGKHVRRREGGRAAPGTSLAAVPSSQPAPEPAPAPGPASPTAEAPTSAAGSSDVPSPWLARWGVAPSVPKQRASVPAPEPRRAAPPPDPAQPSDEGPGRD